MKDIFRVLLMIESSRGFGRSLLRGIAKYARIHGPWLFYNEPAGQERPLPHLQEWAPHGAIIRDSSKITSQKIIDLGIPVIVASHIQTEFPHLPVILTDSREIGSMAAKHLLDRGFTNFGFCGYEDMWWSQGRGEAFGHTIEAAGFSVNYYKQPRARSQRTWQKEQAYIADWLKSLPTPVGLMAPTDDRAKHVIEASKMAELHVPEEIAVLGVDNDDLVCDFSYPAISSIALDTEAAGYEAGRVLAKLMYGEKTNVQNILIKPTHIVTRHSTDILAIDDHEVAEALQFIRRHARGPIQVGDVVNAVAISRRSLYQKFQKALGRSINQEIRRMRVEIIMHMLIETDQTIAQITESLGFTGVDHIARYFKKEVGISPHDYRRSHRTRESMTS